MLIRLFHLSGVDLLQSHTIGCDSEYDVVDDLEEQSRHPKLDTKSEDKDTTAIHSKCENEK